MNWVGKKVLVTGAGGFIGSHLAESLATCGAQVRAFVHYNALGNRGWLDYSRLVDEMEVVSGDVTDRDSVISAMRSCEVVFHLAALIAIPYSYESPRSYIRTNVEGTLNLLQAARLVGVERFVQTSTSEVYGTARYAPIDEDHPLQGQSPYSASKIAADKLAESFHLSFGVPVVTVRPFNTFGPRQSARAVIPTIITQALTSEEIRLGHVHPKRDLNFVSDTISGFLRAGEVEAGIGRTINLGSGREVSIGDVVEIVARVACRSIRIVSDEERKRPRQSEVDRLLADATQAREILGWQSEVDLEEGLTRTIAWVKRNLEHYRPDSYVR